MHNFRQFAVFALALALGILSTTAADKPLKLSGKFTGIEQGDYAHWNMVDSEGNDRSFFILRPDRSVEAVLDNPEKFTGKSCTIQWKSSKEEIPEAGGKIDVEQILSVAWK